MNITWKRGTQISDAIIVAAEQKYKVSLPEDFKSVIRENNNGRPSVNTFDTQVSKEHVFKKLLSFNEDDMETIYKAKHVLADVDETLFPIANDPAGNLICFKGTEVVYWLHEDNSVLHLADSFSEFLEKLY